MHMATKVLYTLLGVFFCVLVGVVVLHAWNASTIIAHAAQRIVVLDRDLFVASDVIGSKRLTSGQNIQMLFDESEDLLLVGGGYEEEVRGNPYTRGAQLMLYRKDGSLLRSVSDTVAEYALFDSHGKNVVYLTPNGEIYIQDVATGAEKKVADHASIPSVAPDDTALAYKKMPEGWGPGEYSDGSPGVVVLDILSGKERVIADGEADHAAYWTPDGEYLYFFGDNGYGLDSLHLINADGRERTLLTNRGLETYVFGKVVPSISEPPIISADGAYIVYESDREIWMVHVDLSSREVIDAKKIAHGTSPQWVEDGKTLSAVFGGGTEGKGALIVVDVNGNIQRK